MAKAPYSMNSPYTYNTSVLDCLWHCFRRLLVWLGLVRDLPRIAFMGLDNTGKTTYLHLLAQQKLSVHPPTIIRPENVTPFRITVKNQTALYIDTGGLYHCRKHYGDVCAANQLDGIVFMISCGDTERHPETKDLLQEVLDTCEEMQGIPIVVVFSKFDLDNASLGSLDAYIQHYDLSSRLTGPGPPTNPNARPMEAFTCSVVKKIGCVEPIEWLLNQVKPPKRPFWSSEERTKKE
eukprot:GFYU01007886.1.p1 GENE.GFYU01007886.1~~GFYU01007886.1.p1  ORF type:complete len:263 (+),score=40.51 GFYU01007886.1:84-791(+)